MRDPLPIDANEMPDVSRLVREVAQSGRPRLLTVNGYSALLSPARPAAPGSQRVSTTRSGRR
jgi:hypothetical protein